MFRRIKQLEFEIQRLKAKIEAMERVQSELIAEIADKKPEEKQVYFR